MTYYIIPILIVIVGIVIAYYVVISVPKPLNLTYQFSAFRTNFISTPKVNIYVNDSDPSKFDNAMGCADNLIELIVANKTVHKYPPDIKLLIYNKTSCAYLDGLNTTDYINTTATKCLSYQSEYPSVFLGFNKSNHTTINKDSLYVEGDSKFLSECGISYELT